MGSPPPAAAGDGAYRQPSEPSAQRRRPWGWIVACGFLVVIAAGFAIWALNINSDLDQQKDETAAAQQQNDEISKQVEDISNEVDQASENAKGILADVKAKLTALVDKIKQALGGSSSGGSGAAATATPAATSTPADAATQAGAEVSATATP